MIRNWEDWSASGVVQSCWHSFGDVLEEGLVVGMLRETFGPICSLPSALPAIRHHFTSMEATSSIMRLCTLQQHSSPSKISSITRAGILRCWPVCSAIFASSQEIADLCDPKPSPSSRVGHRTTPPAYEFVLSTKCLMTVIQSSSVVVACKFMCRVPWVCPAPGKRHQNHRMPRCRSMFWPTLCQILFVQSIVRHLPSPSCMLKPAWLIKIYKKWLSLFATWPPLQSCTFKSPLCASPFYIIHTRTW